MNETLNKYCDIETETMFPVIRKRRILVFDVETTGLIPSEIDPLTKEKRLLHSMPFIIQLSFIVFNMIDFKIERTYNSYIRISDKNKITEKITELTGITQEKCELEGIPVVDSLHEFYNEYMKADYVIAHNINFDRQMVLIEIERNYDELEKRGAKDILNIFNPLFCKIRGIENYCTMSAGKHICNIMVESKTNSNRKPYKKFPKLAELYFTLFHSKPENLHNALVDTLVCLRCFLKIKMETELHEKKYEFMLQSVMLMV